MVDIDSSLFRSYLIMETLNPKPKSPKPYKNIPRDPILVIEGPPMVWDEELSDPTACRAGVSSFIQIPAVLKPLKA